MSKVKYEDKEEGEVSPNLQEVPKVLKEVAQESKPILASYSAPSTSSTTSLPTLLPFLTSSCCDIPVVCYGGNIIQPNSVIGGQVHLRSQDISADDQGDGQDGQAHSSDDQPHDQDGQLHSGDDQQHTVSRVLLSAISPWLASLIEGVLCLLISQ